MKNLRKPFCLILAMSMSIFLLAGCGDKSGNSTDDESDADNTAGAITDGSGQTGGNVAEDLEFSYSEGIDENGFWTGIKALDYVKIFDYRAIEIPNDVHQITDDAVQSEIDYMLTQFPSVKQVTDRPVIDGDKVNIDYVGSVDGVEFENGSTEGMGTDVTIGVTSYIDDFLQQLIGHVPGEVINVEVTFPEVYNEVTLQGKDALFITTINYIIEEEETVLSDAFVAENLSVYFGWRTIEEMRAGIRSNLKTTAIEEFIRNYFTTEVAVQSMPDMLVKYQEKSLLKYYEDYALYYYGLDLNEFLIDYNGFSGVDEFIEVMHDEIITNATFYLVIQAIAEDAGFSVSVEDISAFFVEQNGSGDYSSYEEQFGMPYLKQIVLSRMVIDLVAQNAILL